MAVRVPSRGYRRFKLECLKLAFTGLQKGHRRNAWQSNTEGKSWMGGYAVCTWGAYSGFAESLQRAQMGLHGDPWEAPLARL